MSLAHNFPFFSIILCMVSGVVTSVLKPRAARWLTVAVTFAVLALSAFTLRLTLGLEDSYPFLMGHFPAPWGNEIRVGRLEALMATGLSAIAFLTLLAGHFRLRDFVTSRKENLYYIMVDLALAATLVMIYTNDLFTAYVFIEIMTIASCALVIVRQNGHTLAAATRYMVMNLLASGLTLLGISMLYGITGHLLMEPLHDAVAQIHRTGTYAGPLTVVIALITAGLAIKSAMFPFHGWAPDAYAYAPSVSSAVMSGIISKAYLFLLIKFYWRVIGMDVVVSQHVTGFLFFCGTAGMILASVFAISQKDIRRMVAYSSVAQIGYVYMGIGLGTTAGIAAAIFQMLAHSAAKSLLFLSTYELVSASGDRKRFRYLHGAGYRNAVAGVVFTVSSMSMVGIPFTGGFIAKLQLAAAGMPHGGWTRALVLIAMALSTLLNAVYFLHTVVSIYRRAPDIAYPKPLPAPRHCLAALLLSMLVTVWLGVGSAPVLRVIEAGLRMFA
ncbi:MAG TPA: proton-conducting transporter membrane subunit [Candidatus Limnocylindria bacterium]|nr:proton-conducting transporter membrane subunit [Candidatus Limnocylindria bacterium]